MFRLSSHQLTLHLTLSRLNSKLHSHGQSRLISFSCSPKSSPQPPSLGMATSTYTPFSNSHSIRILTLSPSPDRSTPLIGTLSEQDLDSGTSDTYEAISYVWGNPSRQAEISCNGLPLRITQSIHDALARVRHPDRPRRLWADQICINQDDLAERSQQVELMNLVYKNAEQVLVWLGEDDEGVAERAFGLIRYLHGVFGDEEANRLFQKACSEDLPQESAETWTPLTTLTQLPWVCSPSLFYSPLSPSPSPSPSLSHSLILTASK